MATQTSAEDDEYVHNLGRILRTLAKEARERGGPVGEIIGQGLVSWQGTVGIGLVPFLAKKAGSGECWIFVRKGERWSLTRSIADAMQIITGGAPKRPYRADERELNNSKSIMTRVLGGKAAWAAEMARRWREAVVSSRIDKDRGRRGRPPATAAVAGPETRHYGASFKPEPTAHLRGARLAGAPAPPLPPGYASPAQPLAPAAELPLSPGAAVAAAPSATTFPLSPEAASQWYGDAAAAFDAATAVAPRQSGQALRSMDVRAWVGFEANHAKLYVLAKELAAAKACMDVVELGEKRWTAQEPPAPAWHRVKANAVGAVIRAGDLEASCMLYAVNDPATPPGTAAEVAGGYDAAVARGCSLVAAAAGEALRLGVVTAARPAGLAEWAAAAAAELERRGGPSAPGAGAGPHVPCDKREYCCLPAGHRGHCRKARPEDEEPAAPPVMGKRRSAIAAAAAAAAVAAPPALADFPVASDPEAEFIDVVDYAYEGPEAFHGERTNAKGEALCTRNANCVKLAGHMGRCKIREPGVVDDEAEGHGDRSAARGESGSAPGGGGGGSGPAEGATLPPGVEKCTRHKHCVKEQGHMGRCRIRAPPRRPPGAAARERQMKAAAAAGVAPKEADDESGESMEEYVEYDPCPKDPDCVNWAGHRGRCKIRRPPGADAGAEGPAAKRRRPAAPELDLGHLALLAEMAAMPSPGFLSPPAGAVGGTGAQESPGLKGLKGALPEAPPSRSPPTAAVEGSQQPGEERAAAAAAAAVAGAEKAAAAAVENAAAASPAHLDVAAVLAAAAAVPEEPEEPEAMAAPPPAAMDTQPAVEIAAAEPAALGSPVSCGDAVKPEEPAAGPVTEDGGTAVAAAAAAAPDAVEAPKAASSPLIKHAGSAPLEKTVEAGTAEVPAVADVAPLVEEPVENGAAAAPANDGNAFGGAWF